MTTALLFIGGAMVGWSTESRWKMVILSLVGLTITVIGAFEVGYEHASGIMGGEECQNET